MSFANICCSLVFIAVSIYAIVVSLGFKEFRNSTVNPSAFPRIMAGGLLIFSLLLLVMNLQKFLRNDPNDEASPILSVKDRGIRYTLLCIAISIAYTALWETVGFLILAPVTLVLLMYLIGLRKWPVMIGVSVALTLVMWLLFYMVLTISIPLGPLQVIYDVF